MSDKIQLEREKIQNFVMKRLNSERQQDGNIYKYFEEIDEHLDIIGFDGSDKGSMQQVLFHLIALNTRLSANIVMDIIEGITIEKD